LFSSGILFIDFSPLDLKKRDMVTLLENQTSCILSEQLSEQLPEVAPEQMPQQHGAPQEDVKSPQKTLSQPKQSQAAHQDDLDSAQNAFPLQPQQHHTSHQDAANALKQLDSSPAFDSMTVADLRAELEKHGVTCNKSWILYFYCPF
jgi:hypothetical protein